MESIKFKVLYEGYIHIFCCDKYKNEQCIFYQGCCPYLQLAIFVQHEEPKRCHLTSSICTQLSTGDRRPDTEIINYNKFIKNPELLNCSKCNRSIFNIEQLLLCNSVFLLGGIPAVVTLLKSFGLENKNEL